MEGSGLKPTQGTNC